MITDFRSYLFAQSRIAEEEGNRVYEVVVGLVTEIKDDTKLCRIKVKIPAMPITDNTHICHWVSVGGANDRGWFSLPEVNDEVLVAFEHGDLNRPIILGALWNGKDKAPDNNSAGDNPRRVIKSKTGHKITFEDKEGFFQVEDGGGIGSMKIAKEGKIELTASQGDIAIQCKDAMQILAGEITITAKGNCDLHGKSSGVDATGTAGVKINGNMVMLKGSTIDFNPGGVAQAATASGTVSDVADPVKG
ncbi:MAG: hypothetical protein KBG48_24205 [Kofleriaceae bacterium]|jgi:uncharacterized protein involved in type VI secretion and phage assembly|nr:hypothetical protein [Kofleriaceae bacterium]MBP9170530.1 hypothetical protein [Kofleriaceae bacterium]MBP9860863.1 hypothetical protein [Kofleriaceae bacterium]